MKTKFEGIFKERYDRYWDRNVVTTDSTIKQNLKFFKSNPSVISNLIDEYCQHISNVLNNLYRQLPMFQDHGLVLAYIKDTQGQALEDLTYYSKSLEAYGADVSEINKYISSLSGKKSEEEHKPEEAPPVEINFVS